MSESTVLAFDIGGSKILAGLITQEGKIIDSIRYNLPKRYTMDELEAHLYECGERLVCKHTHCKIPAIGATIPGIADPRTGMWVNAVFSGIHDYPAADRLQNRFGVPVYIENDVNACAWAEKKYGKCRTISDFLWVTISNGSGGGLIINDRIYHGVCGGAGEVGHLVVDETADALMCPCGHMGCLESMAAGPGIVKRYRMLCPETPENIDAGSIFRSARSGDIHAQNIIEKTGDYIGKALAMSANILNLPCYVLGGGVIQDYDMLEASIMKSFGKYAFDLTNHKVIITNTGLGYEAGLLGAAAIAWYPTN